MCAAALCAGNVISTFQNYQILALVHTAHIANVQTTLVVYHCEYRIPNHWEDAMCSNSRWLGLFSFLQRSVYILNNLVSHKWNLVCAHSSSGRRHLDHSISLSPSLSLLPRLLISIRAHRPGMHCIIYIYRWHTHCVYIYRRILRCLVRGDSFGIFAAGC